MTKHSPREDIFLFKTLISAPLNLRDERRQVCLVLSCSREQKGNEQTEQCICHKNSWAQDHTIATIYRDREATWCPQCASSGQGIARQQKIDRLQRLGGVVILCNRAQAVAEYKRLACECQIIAQVDDLSCILALNVKYL